MEHKDHSHRPWTQGKKPSMKHRCEEKDYTERGIYLVTIATEARRPLLGTLAGDASLYEGPDAPHVVLSPLGERVKEEWFGITRYYHQIEVIRLCIMPDHIHGVLFVHEKLPRHLGHVINGFKAGTRRAARELGIIPDAKPAITEAKPLPTKPTPSPSLPSSQATPSLSSPQVTTSLSSPQVTTSLSSPQATTSLSSPQVTTSLSSPQVLYAEALPQSHPQQNQGPKHPPHGTLWEPGYNDRILFFKGQLQRMLSYLDDNPRRLLLKRQHPEYFTQLGTINAAGLPMAAMGNPTLLAAPTKLQVQCSRHLYPWEIEQQKQSFLAAGRKGAVIVSPCISPGEQQIATACMAAGIPLIVLLLKGFPPFFKPQPRYLEACSAGRLLMLAPYPWQNEKLTDMRARCLRLNDLAAAICQQKQKEEP